MCVYLVGIHRTLSRMSHCSNSTYDLHGWVVHRQYVVSPTHMCSTCAIDPVVVMRCSIVDRPSVVLVQVHMSVKGHRSYVLARNNRATMKNERASGGDTFQVR